MRKSMSNDQLQQEGLTGPFELADKSVPGVISELVLDVNAAKKDKRHVNPALVDRHRDITVIREVFFDANLQSALTGCFGQNLLLWRSNFIVKDEGSLEVTWQHSRMFEHGDAPLDIYNTDNHFTVLLAVTDMGFAYIRGSHLQIEGFDRDQFVRHIGELPDSAQDRVTEMPMNQGQFALFHSSLLHRNQPIIKGTPPGILMVGRLIRRGTEIQERFASQESIIHLDRTG